MKNRFASGIATTVLALACQSAPALAQTQETAPAVHNEATSPSDGDIIVTARRASESLLNVPVQVAVQTGEQLARTNTNDLPKLAESVPFVTIAPMTGGNGGGFIVRGIGNFSSDVSVKQTVLLNVDNVFVGRGKIINQGMFDIGQIEVLKGPQALFFGKNSPAGVISISTKDPGRDLEGYVRAGYEFNADQRYLEGAVSVPITDTLAVRVAGRASGMTGYLKNNATGYATNPLFTANPTRFAFLAATPVPGATTDRSPKSDEQAARFTAVWKPTDALSAKFKYAYALTHQNGDSNALEFFCRPGVTAITTAGIPDSQADCNLNKTISYGNFPVALTVNQPFANGGVPYATTKTHLTSLNLDYKADNFAVSSITGYYNLKYRGAQNSFQDSLGSLWAAQTEDATGFSQEVRVNSDFDFPVNFVAGGYYGKTTQKNQTFADLVVLGAGFDPVANSYLTYIRLIRQSSTTLSGFGQLRWDILDNLELSGGVRYTSEKITDLNGNLYANPRAPAGFLKPAGVFFDRSRRFNNASPEATLTWHPDSNQTAYFAYKTGFKSGGFASPPVLGLAVTDASTRYDPEKVKGFEAGYKARLFDRLLNLELTAYRYDYSDLQANVFVAASLGFLTVNAAKARVQGIEGQVTVRPTSGLTLNGTVGYNEAKYQTFIGGACYAGQTLAQGCFPFNGSTTQDLGGRTLPRAPKWGANVGAVYETPLNDQFKATLSGNAIFSSGYLLQDNLDPFAKQDSFWKFNAAVALATSDDKFEISLIGRNLTNKYVAVFSQDKGFGAAGNYLASTARPREISIQGTVRF